VQNKKSIKLMGIVIGLVACLSTNHPASAQNEEVSENDENRFTVEINPEYTSGKYGTRQRTNIFTVPVTGTYETGPYFFSLTVPYLRQTAPAGTLIIRGRALNAAGRRGVTQPLVTQQGLGDVLVSVSRTIVEEGDVIPMVDLGFETKFGTASAKKGLGTGKNDYSPSVDFTKSFDNFTAQINAGYTFTGKILQVNLNNFFFGSVDGSYNFNNEISAGMRFDVSTPLSPGVPPQREFTLYMDEELPQAFKLRLYALKGITNASPDYGGGISLSYKF
jgi:hypothetical protein